MYYFRSRCKLFAVYANLSYQRRPHAVNGRGAIGRAPPGRGTAAAAANGRAAAAGRVKRGLPTMLGIMAGPAERFFPQLHMAFLYNREGQSSMSMHDASFSIGILTTNSAPFYTHVYRVYDVRISRKRCAARIKRGARAPSVCCSPRPKPRAAGWRRVYWTRSVGRWVEHGRHRAVCASAAATRFY